MNSYFLTNKPKSYKRLYLLFFLVLLLSYPVFFIDAVFASQHCPEPLYEEMDSPEKLEEKLQKVGKRYFPHSYWDNGFHIDSPEKQTRLQFNFLVNADAGVIDADDELQAAFPDFDGSYLNLRRARIDMMGTFAQKVTYKGQFDVSSFDGADIQNFYVTFHTYLPYFESFGNFKLGHFKEPFSLEALTSSQTSPFMELSLPTSAFQPGRNIGLQALNTSFYQNLTWAIGVFLNSGDNSNKNGLFDSITTNNGLNLTTRMTGVPKYEDGGKKMIHLGLSYSHQFRNASNDETSISYLTRPESYLTEDTLVSTGDMTSSDVDLLCLETGLINGSVSIQSELFGARVASSELNTPIFWGFYVYSSYFFTGESRTYVRSKGTFTPDQPVHPFRPLEQSWGAWEATGRYSFINLNDGAIQGGKEQNLTLGLNWYFGQYVRVMFNYIHCDVKDRAVPVVDNGRANIYQTRFQFNF